MEKNNFNDILNECLERVLVKGETIEECIASFPQLAEQLEPLLQTAIDAKQASALQPRSEFKARARYQFRSAIQETKSRKGHFFFSWQRWWAIPVTAVLCLLLAGGGTVAAASGSMPDEPLYPVKLVTEQVWLKITPSALGKAELYTRLANRRVTEIVYAVSKGDPEQVEQITQRLNAHLATIPLLAKAKVEVEESGVLRAPALEEGVQDNETASYQPENETRLGKLLAHYAVNHPAVLQQVLETAPEATKPALRRAIAISVMGYKKALEAIRETESQ